MTHIQPDYRRNFSTAFAVTGIGRTDKGTCRGIFWRHSVHAAHAHSTWHEINIFMRSGENDLNSAIVTGFGRWIDAIAHAVSEKANSSCKSRDTPFPDANTTQNRLAETPIRWDILSSNADAASSDIKLAHVLWANLELLTFLSTSPWGETEVSFQKERRVGSKFGKTKTTLG